MWAVAVAGSAAARRALEEAGGEQFGPRALRWLEKLAPEASHGFLLCGNFFDCWLFFSNKFLGPAPF